MGGYIDRFMRRFIDITVSVIGLIILSPLFIIIAILIKRSSCGPVIFKGIRIGYKGKTFRIFKFRTMYERSESYIGAKVTAQDDSRITDIGRWLRRTKINEFPQLLNVLLGEMSLVGPRPEDPEFVALWPYEVRKELLSIRPGITSPATVVYCDEEKLLNADSVVEQYLKTILPDKLRLDQLYFRHRNILSDLDIIFWTMIMLVRSAKSRSISIDRIYFGPFYKFFHTSVSLLLQDMLVTTGAVILSGIIWRMAGPLDLGIGKSIIGALVMALLFSLVNALFGYNRVVWSLARAVKGIGIAFSCTVTTLILIFAGPYFIPFFHLPIGFFIMTGGFAFIGYILIRYRERILTGIASRWLSIRGGIHSVGERVLISGADESGCFAASLLRSNKLSFSFSVIGMVDDDKRLRGMQVDGCKVLGTTHDIPHIVEQYDVGILLFASPNIEPEREKNILAQCKKTIRIISLSDIVETIDKQFMNIRNRTSRGDPSGESRKNRSIAGV